MSPLVANITPCQQLFRKSAEELFPAKDARSVNESLVTLMKIVDHLVGNPEAFFLFDPTAFNNECHLYALFVAQAVREVSLRPFLYHFFFLSYAFLTDPKLLEKLSCKTLKVMKAAAPTQEFILFLKDPESIRIRTHASRIALNELFAERMQTIFRIGESPLDSELAEMALADLQLTPSSGKGELYTFPKFAGVAYFIDALFRERIAHLFKVKVVTEEGVGSFMYSSQEIAALDPAAAVVVFEMVATGDSLTYLECRDIAKRCPSHSRRNPSRKDRHKPTEQCLFCSPNKIDMAPYRQKFQPVLEKSDEMLLALGADFILQNQRSFLRFFSDAEKFPKLTEIFTSSVPRIEQCFLSMKKPSNMSVSHVYTDCAMRAAQEMLVIDAAYEMHVSERGLV